MMTNGKGDPVNLDTPWEGDFNDKTFFTQERYAPYRRADNFKIPYWLQPNLYYAGVAWYQRDVTIPDSWAGKTIRLYLERCHWVSRVWVDGKEAGKQDALSAPHWFDLTPYLTPGKHTLSIRVDNAIRDVDPGVNSHSVSDHTQGNWNGIAGAMLLKAQSPVAYRQVDVYPQLEARRLDVKAYIYNNGVGKAGDVTIGLRVDGEERIFERTVQPGDNLVELSIPLPADVKPWDEFNPNLYQLECTLRQGGEQTDARTVTFGCRTWSVKDGQLTLNGRPVFMRGTLHCAAFPLTGYPATDKEEWRLPQLWHQPHPLPLLVSARSRLPGRGRTGHVLRDRVLLLGQPVDHHRRRQAHRRIYPSRSPSHCGRLRQSPLLLHDGLR